MFKTLKDFDFKNKRVLVRCDFQVPFNAAGEVADDFKIRVTIPTIEYLIKQNAKIILMSHWKPKGTKDLRSLKPVSLRIQELLGRKIQFWDNYRGTDISDKTKTLESGQIVLLENLRFHKEEEANDENFAKQLSELGDIYVNEAFGVDHRAHASLASIPKYVPSAAGLLLEKEIKVLSRVLENPWRPLVVIIGGAKIADKIGVISQFLEKADHLLLGGKIANSILQAKGIIVGKPLLEEEVLRKIERIDATSPKLHLPVDGVISLQDLQDKDYLRVGGIGQVRKEESVFDIGPETIKVFSEIIKSAKMVLWAGPLGMFEEKQFESGTKEVGQSIIRNHSAFKAAGGADTHRALIKFNLADKFDHVSTGGGAMLEFLSGKKLPGIEALEKYGN